MGWEQAMSKVLVIIPAYNEERHIGKVLDGILRLRDSISGLDLLVIDDGSQDRTGRIARTKHVDVVRHGKNIGEEGAIQTGFDYALKHKYEYVVKLDADGQHQPSEALKVLNPLLKDEADVVIGSRLAGYPEPLLFKLGRVFCSTLISFLLRQRISDPTSGFKGRNRAAVEYSRRLYLTTRSLHNDLVNDIEELLLYSKEKMRIKEVAVNMNKRHITSKVYFSFALLKFPLVLFSAIGKCLFMTRRVGQAIK